jgi:DNA-binding CsgD family transcriptional regulator
LAWVRTLTEEIVGRDEELARLGAFLATDAARALVLEGRPGIGKTTLWRAAVGAASERSLRVLTAQPAEAERELAYAGLGDLLEDVLGDVLPELPPPRRRALEAALLLADADDAAAEPRVVAAGVQSLLRLLAEDGPLLVAVDDVQWLDASSGAALAFALRRSAGAPILTLLARRAEEPPSELEHALPDAERIDVGRLSVGAIHGLLKTRLGRPLPRPALLRLHEVSGGNPFYALELARALLRTGMPAGPSAPLPVPESLERLVADRLRVLPRSTRDALLLVATAGTPTGALLTEAGVEQAALEPAVEAQVLDLADGEVRFSHPLLASEAISQATRAERRDAHRRLAAVVEDPVARAHHVAAALEAPDAGVAAALEDAAGLARSRGSAWAAAELGEAAVRATPPELENDRRRRALGAARDHFTGGAVDRAAPLARAELARAAPGRARAEALLLLAAIETNVGTVERAVEHGRAALAEAAGVPELELVAHQQLAYDTRIVDGLHVAERHAREAVRLSEQLGSDALTARALAPLAIVRFNGGHPDAFALAERALELARRSGDESAVRDATEAHAHCLSWSGQAVEARAFLSDALAAATERNDIFLGTLFFYLELVEERAGRLDRAQEHAERLYELALQDGGPELATSAPISGALARLAALRGDEALARELTFQSLAHADSRPPSALGRSERAHLAIVDAWAGDAAAAVARFEEVDAERRAAGFSRSTGHQFAGEWVEALLALGRVDDAEATLADWEDEIERDGHSWVAPTAVRARGLVAAARGDVPAAVELLEQAVAGHEAIGDPFGRARALLALGVTRRRARQKRAAREALEAAVAGFEEMGAAGWAARARSEVGRIGGRTRQDDLTPAERRVAALVAEGRTNREVAAALFLGERTVETHLSHVYAKLGIRSRTELARTLR